MANSTINYEPRRPRPRIAGGIPLFRLFGIQVSLHWSWFIIAIIMIQNRTDAYSSITWNIAEYLALFAIVLMHEFGHALACRSVGGRAEFIMLWPLGGVAFVDPPQRPGAMLWSLAAGPLVNVVLFPVLIVLARLVGIDSWAALAQPVSNLQHFMSTLIEIDAGLFIFNMLPIYPLDGGQILRSLLWYVIGPIRSLKIATIIGLIGAGLGMLFALYVRDMWLIVIALFAASQSWNGFRIAGNMAARARPQVRLEARCPNCGAAPPIGPAWQCQCGTAFDIFEHQGRCPHCGGMFPQYSMPIMRTPKPTHCLVRPASHIRAQSCAGLITHTGMVA